MGRGRLGRGSHRGEPPIPPPKPRPRRRSQPQQELQDDLQLQQHQNNPFLTNNHRRFHSNPRARSNSLSGQMD